MFSYVRSRKSILCNEAFAHLQNQLRLDETESPTPFSDWVEDAGLVLEGLTFSFARHEYLIEPYRDEHPFQVECKAAQMGLTTKAILRALHAARFRGFKGILYLFPTLTDVLAFSRARVAPLISQNPESIGAWMRDTDAAELKQVWNTFIYFRGMRSTIQLKSIPVDFIIFDELDEAPPTQVDVAMERMSHSEFREVLQLSNPTLPDYGIDAAFQRTDQRYWLLKCPHCGEHTCMEETFPECLVRLKDRVIRACMKCRGELDPAVGAWVARAPRVVERRGYHYSQLFSQFVTPAEILTAYETTDNLTAFYNLKLGIAYVEAENRLTTEEVLALCSTDGLADTDTGPCAMGVDQGRDLHVVIGKQLLSGRIQAVHLGIYRDWEELDRLMENFKVSRCVVDAMPEMRNARDFADRWPTGRVYLCSYQAHRKGRYLWNDRDSTVSCDRTESLDASHRQVMEKNLALPREVEVVREFAVHLHNVARKLEEKEETGEKRYVYVKLGPDHFRHAFNYFVMAVEPASGGFFDGYDLR